MLGMSNVHSQPHLAFDSFSLGGPQKGKNTPLCSCHRCLSLIPPRPDEKERETRVSRHGWPQHDPALAANPGENEIQHHGRTVEKHSIERPKQVAVRPTSYSQSDQADAGDAADHNACASDLSSEQKPKYDCGKREQHQTSYRLTHCRDHEESFHCAFNACPRVTPCLGRLILCHVLEIRKEHSALGE
jgi:hypothetical protein